VQVWHRKEGGKEPGLTPGQLPKAGYNWLLCL